MAILTDYSQILHALVFEFENDIKKQTNEEFLPFFRHLILNSLLMYKKKFGRDYGNMYICCDGNEYWRKDIFPYYKHGRKEAKEESSIDWNRVYECSNTILNEIKQFVPWAVLRVNKAEADDIFAVMCGYFESNELNENILDSEPQSILIISSDGDNKQLTVSRNITQYNPVLKAFITQLSAEEIRRYKVKHVVKASDDGIPNIFMPEDHFVNGTSRQRAVTQEVLDMFCDDPDVWEKIPRWKVDSKDSFHKDGKPKRVEVGDEEYFAGIELAKVRYEQNKQLVLYENIPNYVKELIIENYKETKPQSDRNILMSYLMANKLKVLLADLGDF